MKVCNICGYVDSNDDYSKKCMICNSIDWCDYDIYTLKQISADESFLNAMLALKEKDPIEYQLKLQQFKLQSQQARTAQNSNKPHCPHCQSTNIKPISGLNRGASIAMWGIFSKKINKSFECLDCKYTW